MTVAPSDTPTVSVRATHMSVTSPPCAASYESIATSNVAVASESERITTRMISTCPSELTSTPSEPGHASISSSSGLPGISPPGVTPRARSRAV